MTLKPLVLKVMSTKLGQNFPLDGPRGPSPKFVQLSFNVLIIMVMHNKFDQK